MIKVLVTGSNGFIGQNLISKLANDKSYDIQTFTHLDNLEDLKEKLFNTDFVCHFAGVNRSKNKNDFYNVNEGLTKTIVNTLYQMNNTNIPILFTSSIHADLDNDYGKSKRNAEKIILEYSHNTHANVYIYRLSNLFGKWSKPNYNSVVATFCYNLSHNLPIKIDDPNKEIVLNYIDDVVDEFINIIKTVPKLENKYLYIKKKHKIKLKSLADKLIEFSNIRNTLIMPSLINSFDRELYATYISYLSLNDFGYQLKKKSDNRGWLAEFIKSKSFGQIFISTTHPGITRGNHWHRTKTEKFFVINGHGLINLRKVGTKKIISYDVSGDNPTPIDIPAGYVHNIKNIGKNDMTVLFWSDELFDLNNSDTYYEEV